MAIKKYGDAQEAKVAYVGEEARVVNEHLRKVGKPLSEFDKEETKSLQAELAALSPTKKTKNASVETGADPEGDKDE